jgi:rare lipoprotein A (peptidoglycan hydrolase)
MRRLLKRYWGGIFWAPFLFLALPLAQEPAVARATPPPAKPLRVWEGAASWYGQDFEGRTTASGEPYDMYANTAAEPNLPFGSIVRLVNTRTRKAEVVRINDRGPFVNDRAIDVSYGVACRLGIVNGGVSELRIELLAVPTRPE